MRCGKCGRATEIEDRFCRECGSAIERAATGLPESQVAAAERPRIRSGWGLREVLWYASGWFILGWLWRHGAFGRVISVVGGLIWLVILLSIVGALVGRGAQPGGSKAAASKIPTVDASKLGTPGPSGPLNPHAGYGASRATIDRAWRLDHSVPCNVNVGCQYSFQGLSLGVTFFGSRQRVNHIDLQITNQRSHADLWRFEQELIPVGARLLRCSVVTPSDQGGPVKVCIFSWEGRNIVQAEYLEPDRPINEGFDGVVQAEAWGPFDDVIPAKGRPTIVPAPDTEPALVPTAAPRPTSTPTPFLLWDENVIQVLGDLKPVRADFVAAARANDPSTAEGILQQAQQALTKAQTDYNNGPLPPADVKLSDSLIKDELGQFALAIQDYLAGLQNNDTSLVSAGNDALDRAMNDEKAAANALLHSGG